METLSVVTCSPGGNITALVFTMVDRTRKSDVAWQIRERQPAVQQVGFIEEPNDPLAVSCQDGVFTQAVFETRVDLLSEGEVFIS